MESLIFLSLFIFVFGLIIGSFLNVVILRHNTGRNIGGRSSCPHCGYKLIPIDLIPVLSWVFLWGRCRKCRSRISIQYPLVEISTGILFLLFFLKFFIDGGLASLVLGYSIFPAVILALQLISVSLLIIIFVYDLYHKIIPDGPVFTFAIIGFALQILGGFLDFAGISDLSFSGIFSSIALIDILNLFSGIILALPFVMIWYFSGGRAMGLGDAKLILGIGWFLGFILGINALFLAFYIGAIFAVSLMLIVRLYNRGRHITMKSEIPFGPFLILATIIEFLWNYDFSGIGMFFK